MGHKQNLADGKIVAVKRGDMAFEELWKWEQRRMKTTDGTI